ncbi:TonB-dependent receptor [Hyphococcus luteus]|nr:TonB-dependent receptor [Marinicaulis flavus]
MKPSGKERTYLKTISQLMGGAATGVFSIIAPSYAQSDEIIVTATKREQTLQEVPIAVSVVDDRSIEQSNVQDLFDLQTMVPSLRISQLQNSSQTNFTIRGFGNGANNPGIESSVGVFIDGVYRSRSAAAILDLPVLERVEILRGPQSTLFGKNVSAGAISITTKRPEFEWGGNVEASYGRFDEVIFKGSLTGPISENLAFRISGSTNNREGFYTNVIDGSDINERDRWSVRADLLFEPTENVTFRVIGDYNKIDEVCCGAIQIFNGPATTFAIGAPPPVGLGRVIDSSADRDFSVAYDARVENRLTGKGISGQMDWDLGGAALTSITAYREQSDFSETDADFSGAAIITNPQDREFKTFTQEIRLASTGDNTVDWLIGGFFFDEKVNSSRDVIFGADARGYTDGLTALLGAPGALGAFEAALMFPAGTFFQSGTGVFGDYRLDDRSYSVFGQLDFHLTDRLTLSGGVAYLYDKKEVIGDSLLTDALSNIDLVQVGFAGAFQTITGLPPTPANLGNPAFAGAVAAATAISTTACTTPPSAPCNSVLGLAPLQFFDPQVNFPNANESGVFEDDKVTYTLRAAYDVSDWLNAYFTYSKGWKAAAVNLSSDSSPPDPVTGLGRAAGPEDVTLYEVGFKAKFDQGYINFAVFDQTIEGFQSNIFIGTGFVLANAGEQSARGFEVESLWQPWEQLVATAGLTYLDPEYDSFPNAPCASFVGAAPAACLVPGASTFDASGLRPAGISKWSAALSLTYTQPLTETLEMYLRGEADIQSDVATVENVPAAISSRNVEQLNLSLGFNWENGFEIQGWMRNALNDKYLIQSFPTTAQQGSFTGYLNEPRTYGVTIRKKF